MFNTKEQAHESIAWIDKTILGYCFSIKLEFRKSAGLIILVNIQKNSCVNVRALATNKNN
nr:hypothetical protein BCU37_05830 [Vibrio splendidus]PMK57439.1 hypothetical protein BCT96_04125 [Vibrio splendidus]